LTTAQLAKAFLTSEATMTKRIARAKRKIGEARIPLAVPSGAEAEARLGEVLACIYVMFNEGYLSAGPEQPERAELAGDAEWLASLVVKLVPDDPEALGLLALIRLHQARRAARFDAEGRLVLLQDQDRSLWDRGAIADALATLNRALRQGQPGFFQGQAAIAGCHATAPSWQETRWDLIVSLYDSLLSITDSPVVALNRAIGVLHRDGPAEALGVLQDLRRDLEAYHLFHAAMAEVLRRSGRSAEALAEDRRAAELTENPAERSLLSDRIRRGSFPDLEGVFSKN
jgi:RNA polymerase sigma-70 factor (ECF subfamily)